MLVSNALPITVAGLATASPLAPRAACSEGT